MLCAELGTQAPLCCITESSRQPYEVTVHKGAYRGNEQPEHRANTDVPPEPVRKLQLHADFWQYDSNKVTSVVCASQAA